MDWSTGIGMIIVILVGIAIISVFAWLFVLVTDIRPRLKTKGFAIRLGVSYLISTSTINLITGIINDNMDSIGIKIGLLIGYILIYFGICKYIKEH